MGRILDLLKAAGGEESLFSLLGQWRQAVSGAVDSLNSLTFSQPYLTQTDWFIDPVNGNDANDGATAATALQSPGEIARRWNGRVFSPLVMTVNVTYLAGTYTEPLVLSGCAFIMPTTVTIQGVMVQQYSGSISVFTNANPGGNVRSQLQDNAMPNFAVHAQRRLRMTSGGAVGQCTFVCPTAGGGPTIANVGQFTASSVSTQTNPLANDTYVIETFASVFPGIYINLQGVPNILVRDCEFNQGSGSTTTRMQQGRGTFGGRPTLFGCAWAGATVHVTEGAFNRAACVARSDISQRFYNQAFVIGNGDCVFALESLGDSSSLFGSHAVHDGNGTKSVQVLIDGNSYVEDSNERGFFGNTAVHVVIQDNSQWVCSAVAALFWGATGNTGANALTVRNGCGMSYVTKPTATANAPGSDVVLAGGAAIAWAAVPAIAASPDNAFVNVRH